MLGYAREVPRDERERDGAEHRPIDRSGIGFGFERNRNSLGSSDAFGNCTERLGDRHIDVLERVQHACLSLDLCAEQETRDFEVRSADRRNRLRATERCIVKAPRSGRRVNRSVAAENDERRPRVAEPFHRIERHAAGRLTYDDEAFQTCRRFGIASRATQETDAIGHDEMPSLYAHADAASPEHERTLADTKRLVERCEVGRAIGISHVLWRCAKNEDDPARTPRKTQRNYGRGLGAKALFCDDDAGISTLRTLANSWWSFGQ